MQPNRIKLGDPVFNSLLFVLKRNVTSSNHLDYRFMNGKLREIASDVWAMPACLSRNFSLFFIFTKIETGDSVIAFSTGHFDPKAQSFSLSRPMLTGRGLNCLYQHRKNRAVRVAHFLNQISKAAEGDWHSVKK